MKRKSKEFFDFGIDQYNGRSGPDDAPGYPLSLFRENYIMRVTKNDILNDEESERSAKLINERDSFLSQAGIN